MFALAAKYHIEPRDVVRSSVAPIKDSLWFLFFLISMVALWNRADHYIFAVWFLLLSSSSSFFLA